VADELPQEVLESVVDHMKLGSPFWTLHTFEGFN